MKTLNDLLERLWYRNDISCQPLLIVLWPLSLLFQLLARLRRYYLTPLIYPLSVPVVVVGNISVGGTGKTPLLCELAIQLRQRGVRVGIISRGYGGSHTGTPKLVQSTDSADAVGDEPLLMTRMTGSPVVIGRHRLDAAHFLLTQVAVDLILSDDGMQHYALPRTLEIAVLDGRRGTGNGYCLPAGPLREPVSRLKTVDFVVVNGAGCGNFLPDALSVPVLQTHLQARHWVVVHSGEILPLDTLSKGTTVNAVAGIGNPARFFDTLRLLGLEVLEHPFADHHVYNAEDLQFNNAFPVVMTEKDAVKCISLANDDFYALHVQMELPAVWLDQLQKKIEKLSLK